MSGYVHVYVYSGSEEERAAGMFVPAAGGIAVSEAAAYVGDGVTRIDQLRPASPTELRAALVAMLRGLALGQAADVERTRTALDRIEALLLGPEDTPTLTGEEQNPRTP